MPNPYGLWSSPITPKSLAASLRLSDVAFDTSSETLVWLEGRSGQGVLCARQLDDAAPRDLTADLNVRARVGYGGGDFTVSHGAVFFCANGRLWRQELADGAARPITPEFGDAASPAVSPDGQWVMYVHTAEGVDRLAIVDAKGKRWPVILAEGDDFYMQPAWSPSSHRVAWISWSHPNMPWDGTELHMATFDAERCSLSSDTVVAGDAETSVFGPTFSPDGSMLAYASDATGWYNLKVYRLGNHAHGTLVEEEAEHASPAWVQGVRCYAWAPDSQSLYYQRGSQGQFRLWQVDVAKGGTQRVAAMDAYTNVSQVAVSPSGALAAIVSNAKTPTRIVAVAPGSERAQVLRHSATETVPAAQLASPEAISWPTTEGDTSYGLLYKPVGPGAAGELPPLIVRVHGGPTSQSVDRYEDAVQFFCTRGYAVLQVNYRGSTGYGRAYRNKLREQWGIRDCDDCVTGAQYLAESKVVDGSRMVIMGGSAGGYAVLQALVRYPGVFKAGLSLYGVTNLFTLASDTHKFEARYCDTMVGPLPQTAQRYHDRSPVFFADRIQDPVGVFQGEIDRVVPKDQAETIVAALRSNGVPHEYHLYPGEGHGWRKGETIEQFYTSVIAFLKQYVLFA